MLESLPPSQPNALRAPSLTTARIETLTDGVFAIVMTLLVFGLVTPGQELVEQVGLGGALLTLTPNLFAYAISFIILGVYWVGHHNQFFYIKRTDRTLLWINIVFMMFVALVPFSAGLISRYGSDRLSIILYNLNLICIGIILYWHWWYGTRDNHLLNVQMEPQIRDLVTRRILTPPVLYLIGIVVSFFSVAAAIIISILIPILYALPSRIDHIFRR